MEVIAGTVHGLDEPVTALVCTADRPEMIVRAVESIFASTHSCFDVIVVDQSRDGASAAALDHLRSDTRFRYISVPRNGKGAALNRGLAEARSEVVVCTDDDCVVSPEWLGRMAAAVTEQPEVAVVFGDVEAESHDPAAGFVPAYRIGRDRLITSILGMAHGRGIGASMALRRSAIWALGGFDPAFGPGARFPSCDDWDIAFRALLGGFSVYENANARVVHYGFRTMREGRAHVRRDWYAIGAVCSKPIKAGHWQILAVTAELFLLHAVWPPIRDLLELRRPTGVGRIVGFTKGFISALRIPVQRHDLVFELPPQVVDQAAR